MLSDIIDIKKTSDNNVTNQQQYGQKKEKEDKYTFSVRTFDYTPERIPILNSPGSNYDSYHEMDSAGKNFKGSIVSSLIKLEKYTNPSPFKGFKVPPLNFKEMSCNTSLEKHFMPIVETGREQLDSNRNSLDEKKEEDQQRP